MNAAPLVTAKAIPRASPIASPDRLRHEAGRESPCFANRKDLSSPRRTVAPRAEEAEMDRTPVASHARSKAPEHLNWDIAAVEFHDCTLATAGATPSDIVLNFGGRQARGEGTAEVGPELMRRIALSPLTARNLAATLRRLIDEHVGGAR